jgi:thiamine biosynthesis lipoprotein
MTLTATTAVATAEWDLWSTTARIVVTDPACLTRARLTADAHLAGVDRVASRFRPDSEISRMQPRADGSMLLSGELADLLSEALWAARLTDGAVDPTVGTAMVALGYDRDLRLISGDEPLFRPIRPAPGWNQLRLSGRRLWMPAGIMLDLGATAKAVAADRLAAKIHGSLGTGVLVSLGGDIATAGRGPEGEWQIDVDGAETVSLPGGFAIATSSTVERTWRRGGRTMHHIVDPASGQPAAPVWRTVTVAADTCVQANTITTAAVVRGRAAAGWIEMLGNPARLEAADGSVRLLNGWPS